MLEVIQQLQEVLPLGETLTYVPDPEGEARAAIVADDWVAQIAYERTRWLLTPPLGNTLFLTRCFSGQRLRLC